MEHRRAEPRPRQSPTSRAITARRRSTAGLIAIQNYVPMWANFKAQLRHRRRRRCTSIASRSTPTARRRSPGRPRLRPLARADLPGAVARPVSAHARDFFAKETGSSAATATSPATFHLFKGGHDLAGNFTSQLAASTSYRFPSLYGSLHWTRKLFEVTNAGAQLYGGNATLRLSIQAARFADDRPTARFEASYTDVDLARVHRLLRFAGLRFAGSAPGSNLLEWPLGRFREHRGGGQLVAIARRPASRR